MQIFLSQNLTLYSAFFDFGSLGFVDLLQITQEQNKSTQIKSYINYMNNDTFFLKAYSYNGNFKENGVKSGGIYYGTTY